MSKYANKQFWVDTIDRAVSTVKDKVDDLKKYYKVSANEIFGGADQHRV